MPPPLISALAKVPLPSMPLGWEGEVPIVTGADSVSVELRITGATQHVPVGAHIVFVIDNSGSMGPDPPHSDPDGRRFAALQALIDAFASTRNALDRIAVVTFQGSEVDGDLAVVVDTPDAPWKTWTQTAARIQPLRSQSAGGKTPLADAMLKANALLIGSNSFYRLAILLSDGLPMPDDDDCPQTSSIVNDIIPNECVPNRIMYSTIYLYTQPPEDNPLLMYIARHTDYISAYQAGDPPAYYFRISSPDEIAARYRALFESVKERLVPQDVWIAERVDSRLLIDPDAAVTVTGSGFVEERNLLGGVPLDTLLAQFRSSHQLELHLNELAGELVLRFSVKLNLSSVTDAEYANGFVYVNVDVPAGSTISWLDPGSPTGALSRTLGLPQARIKFDLGLHVAKEPDPIIGTVRIHVNNIDSRPVQWFELAEFPSSYVDVANVDDDFDFHPFRMLYEKRILPWFLGHVPLDGLSQQAAELVRTKVRDALRLTHTPVLKKEAVLDRYLSQFGFYENKPGSGIYDAYWSTPSQRGFYRAMSELPARSTRTLTFDIAGATYLLAAGPDQMLAKPADALEPKGLWTMSEYTADGLGDWKRVPQNPVHFQIASAVPQADLFLRTCFSAEHVYQLRKLFAGSALPNPLAMLDSADISPVWRPLASRPRLGAAVTLYNGGDTASTPTRVRAVSVYLPLTENDLHPPRTSGGAITVSRPFFGSAEIALPSVAARSRWSGEVLFRAMFYMVTEGEPGKVDTATLRAVKDAIVITTIDVAQASNECLQNNNSAIEIVPLQSG